MSLKINSFNVRGLGNKTKRDQVFQWLKNESMDIYLLQETHSSSKDVKDWKHQWGGEAFFSGRSSNSQGVAILLNPKCTHVIQKYTEIIEGKLQAIEIMIDEKLITIINIYGSNLDDIQDLIQLEKYLNEHDENTFMIGGDFNTVLDTKIDKKNGRSDTHKKCREKIQNIMAIFNLIDVWRVQHPETAKFTWHSNTRPPIFSRLDYFLISENILNSVNKTEIKAGFKSDHSIVTMTLSITNISRGPGTFKLNNSLLLEEDYQNIIRNSIKDITELNVNANPNTLWELIKGCIRNESIKYSSFKKKMQSKKEQELQTNIDKLENKIKNSLNQTIIEEATKEINENKQELDNIVEYKVKGMVLRAKAEMVESNEKNTKYFASLEKKSSEKKLITQLNVQGKVITDQKDIRSEQKSFYQNLYKKETVKTLYKIFSITT